MASPSAGLVYRNDSKAMEYRTVWKKPIGLQVLIFNIRIVSFFSNAVLIGPTLVEKRYQPLRLF